MLQTMIAAGLLTFLTNVVFLTKSFRKYGKGIKSLLLGILPSLGLQIIFERFTLAYHFDWNHSVFVALFIGSTGGIMFAMINHRPEGKK